MKQNLSADTIELKSLRDITKRLVNIYQLKPQNIYGSSVFSRDDLKIPCAEHPSENLERILLVPTVKKRLYCIECIIDEKDSLKDVKHLLLPIHEYLSQMVFNLEENEPVNEQRIQTMHDGLRDFMEEHDTVETAYTNIIENEKSGIDMTFDELNFKLQESIKTGSNDLKTFFDQQNDVFRHNSELMLSIIKNTYYLDLYPNRTTVYNEVHACKDSQDLEDTINKYLKILHPNDIQETLAIFDIIHINFSNTLDNPIKFEANDYLKNKQNEIVTYVKGAVTDIVRHYKEIYSAKQLKKLKAEDFHDFHKNLSLDCLSGFISFEDQLSHQLKHQIDINSPNNREFTCVTNIHNKYLVYGCKDGCIEIYRVTDGKYIKTLQRHQDYVSFITHFEYYNQKGESDVFIVSTGANDRSIHFWNIISGEMIFSLDNHEAVITSIIDVGSGKHLISASSDGTMIVWNIELQSPVQIIKDTDYASKPKNYFNCLTLKVLNNRSRLIKADLKGNLSIYLINEFEEQNYLHQINIIQINKPITHLFSSKIKQNYFIIKTTDSKIHLMDAETGAIKKTHEVSKSGDVVLLENRNSIFDQEFILINTNSIDNCVSNSYLDDVPAVYVRDFLFSGLCSRNRVQLIQDVADDFRLVVLTKTLGSSIYAII